VSVTDQRLLQWLRDARAIEKRSRKMVEDLSRHIENYPEIRAQAEQLIQQTQVQAATLQDYMERASTDSILVPQKPANLANEKSLSGAFVGSESLKHAMTEISSYNILLAAAESVGDSETRAVCDTIRRQEEAMIEWLRQFLGSATETHVMRRRSASKSPGRVKPNPPGPTT
jgi:ferritin-like metal-binding protein YciE